MLIQLCIASCVTGTAKWYAVSMITRKVILSVKLIFSVWGTFSFKEDQIRVPTRTGKPVKPGKMGRHFPVREKSGNFEQTGKVGEKSGKITQNTGKLREFEINII